MRWWESQALALAFLVGYAGQFGPPRTPLGEVPPGAQDWLVWIVLAVGVLYSSRPRRWRLLRSRPVIAAASLALLLRAMIEHHWEGLWALAWCCGLFALLLGSWWILLMCWDEACEYAMAQKIAWPLDEEMSDSLAAWEADAHRRPPIQQ